MGRKIEEMHAYFGVIQDKQCKDCCNFVHGRYHTRVLSKCTVYGATHSEASDWRMKYVACGLFNKEWKGGEMMRVFQSERARERQKKQFEPLDGQRSMFDADE